MAQLRDLHYARYVDTYRGLPIAELDALGQTRQTAYDEGLKQSDLLSGAMAELDVRDVNRPIVDEIVSDVNEELGQLAEQGNYENAAPKLRALSLKIANNKVLRGALQDKAKFDAYNKQLDERYQKGEITPERYQEAKTMANAMNNKSIEYDPASGTYKNMWDAYNPMNKVDISKKLNDFVSKIKSSENPIKFGEDKDGNPIYMTHTNNQYFITGKEEGLSEQEAISMISNYIASDPEVAAYIKEGVKFESFRDLYDPLTGQERSPTLDDIEAINPNLTDMAKLLGVDVENLTDDQVKELYQAAQVEKHVRRLASPYASAASFRNLELNYHKDNEYLSKLNKQLELNNALKRIAAQEAANKRLAKYKDDLKQAEKLREKYVNTLSTPMPAESIIEPNSTEANIETINRRLAEINAMRASGQALSTGVLNEEITLVKDKRLNEAKHRNYMAKALKSSIHAEQAWQEYLKMNPDPPIGREQFMAKLLNNEINTPKQIDNLRPQRSTFGQQYNLQSNKIDDPKDVNTYLKRAKKNIFSDNALTTQINLEINREGNELTSQYTGYQLGAAGPNIANNPKANYVDAVSQMVSQQIAMSSGVGYDVSATGKPLNEVITDLNAQLTGEDGKPVGKYVILASPSDRPQVSYGTYGNLEPDLMYNLKVVNSKTGKTVFQGRVRPHDQQVHADLTVQMNDELMKVNPANTEIHKRAEITNALIKYPQFDLDTQEVLLDGVKPEDMIDVSSFGSVIHIPGAGKFIYRAANRFLDTDRQPDNMLVVRPKEKKKIVQLVKVKDNTPLDVVITSDNINNYLNDPEKGVDGNALPRWDYITNPEAVNQLSDYKQAYYFDSPQDALLTFSRIQNGQASQQQEK